MIKLKTNDPHEGQLRVWHIPQAPGKPFEIDVQTPQEAKRIIDMLAAYDLFQFKNRIKPDYTNASGLLVFEDGEWVEWYDENGDDIDSSELIAA